MEFSSTVIPYQFNNKTQEKYRAVCFFSSEPYISHNSEIWNSIPKAGMSQWHKNWGKFRKKTHAELDIYFK